MSLVTLDDGILAWLDPDPGDGRPNAGLVVDADAATAIDTLCVPSQSATFVAAVFYEFIFHDSSRVLPPAQRDFLWGHKAHGEHRDARYGPNANRLPAGSDYSASDDKAHVDHQA